MIKIFIADPHEIMRARLHMLLGCVTGLQVAGLTGNADDLLSRARAGGIDVLLLDLSLPPYDDTTLIGQIRKQAPDLKILVLSRNDEEHYLSRIMAAGADACLTIASELNDLIATIRRVGSMGRQDSRAGLPSFFYA